MHIRRLYGTVALTLLVAAASCDGAGETDGEAPTGAEEQVAPQPMDPQMMDPQMMQRVMEVQQIQQQLEPVSQQATQDPELSARLVSLQSRIQAAMREENPEVVDRMDSLQEELMAAQQSGDQAGMQELMTNAQGLQMEFQALQSSVLQRPAIRESIEEFETAHRARMIEIDPEAEPLLERLDELVAQLPTG